MPNRIILWVLGVLVLLGLGTALVGSAMAAKQLTSRTPSAVGDPPPELAASTEAVTFPSTDGLQLHGWFVRSDGAKVVALLLHGNGASRTQMEARAALLHAHGYAVLLYDARGHGESPGELTSAGFLETADLNGALDFVHQRGFQHVGCLGESQGGATIALDAKALPAAVEWVVLESTYPTMRDALDTRLRMAFHLPGWLTGAFLVPFAEHRVGFKMDDDAPIRRVGQIRCPVMVMGGEKDRHTVADSTRALYQAVLAPKRLWIVPGAAHVDLYGFAHADYEAHLLGFLADLTGGATRR